ncbi:MAG: HAMP domain-containing protein [Burkholderiaceae bacterium]|nr:HAMP domain-containing protein [Burkholderiaceae bacterium]
MPFTIAPQFGRAMEPMRLRLVHLFCLSLIACTLVTVLAMGGLTAWNLREGFGGYLRAHDDKRLQRFADFLAAGAVQPGGLAALVRQAGWPTLLRRFAMQAGDEDGESPRFARDDAGPHPPRGPMPGMPGMPGIGPRAWGRDALGRGALPPDGFSRRVALFDAHGHQLGGPPMPSAGSQGLERTVGTGERVIGRLRLMPTRALPDPVAREFLLGQYRDIALVGLAVALLALVAALGLGRRLGRPLQALQHATAEIAKGRFDIRLPGDRATEIGQLMRDVNEMAAELEQSAAMRSRWIADVSHELRTPLSILQGEVEAMLDGVRPTDHAALASLREELLHLARLVDDLHLLSRSDLGELPRDVVACDAADLLRSAIRRFELRARQRGIGVVSDLPDAIAVTWDPRRMAQVFDNLIENSLRYTDASGSLRIHAARVGDRVTILVEDSAPGVPAEALARLFDPLYRADAARSREHGGSGLGLAICAAIVKAHGGSITARASMLGGVSIELAMPASSPS